MQERGKLYCEIYQPPKLQKKLIIFFILLSIIVGLFTVWLLPILESFAEKMPEEQVVEMQVVTLPEKLQEEDYQVREDSVPESSDELLVEPLQFEPKISLPLLDVNLAFDNSEINLINNTASLLKFGTEVNGDTINPESFSNDNFSKLVFELSEVDVNPVLLANVLPIYPFRARNRNITGEVVLQFEIDLDGKPRNIILIDVKPKGYQFENAAIKAVEQWRFKPAKKNSQNVVVRREVSLIFKLDK